jgi:quercetin dioxygenase-like cupin family protein
MFGFLNGRHHVKLAEIKSTLDAAKDDLAEAYKLFERPEPFTSRRISADATLAFDHILMGNVIHCHKAAVSVAKIDKGIVIPAHDHTQNEILIQITGTVRYIINGGPTPKVLQIGPGGYATFAPGQLHAAEYLEDSIVLAITLPASPEYPGHPGCGTADEGALCNDCPFRRVLQQIKVEEVPNG